MFIHEFCGSVGERKVICMAVGRRGLARNEAFLTQSVDKLPHVLPCAAELFGKACERYALVRNVPQGFQQRKLTPCDAVENLLVFFAAKERLF